MVVGGLAVVVVGEPRTTADADAIVFVSFDEAESLIQQALEMVATMQSQHDATVEFETALRERNRLGETDRTAAFAKAFDLGLLRAEHPSR